LADALTCNCEFPPAHIEAGVAVTDAIVGVSITVTVTVAVARQPPGPVPETVYVVVCVGEAFTEAPVVALSPVAGVHVYVLVEPDAVNATGEPGRQRFPAVGDTVIGVPTHGTGGVHVNVRPVGGNTVKDVVMVAKFEVPAAVAVHDVEDVRLL